MEKKKSLLEALAKSIAMGSSPRYSEMAHALTEKSWQETEIYYRDYMPQRVEQLSKHMGKCIWQSGYKVDKTHFETECEHYDKFIGLGVFCDVLVEKTYAQRFYPLFSAFEAACEELKDIKSKWWYKLFTFFQK